MNWIWPENSRYQAWQNIHKLLVTIFPSKYQIFAQCFFVLRLIEIANSFCSRWIILSFGVVVASNVKQIRDDKLKLQFKLDCGLVAFPNLQVINIGSKYW
jgi:hypothetical protein